MKDITKRTGTIYLTKDSKKKKKKLSVELESFGKGMKQ